jgi:hypothetical protein
VARIPRRMGLGRYIVANPLKAVRKGSGRHGEPERV